MSTKILPRLPDTKLCIVVWYRNNAKQEDLLIETPANYQVLETVLLRKKIAMSEVRAIKAVEPWANKCVADPRSRAIVKSI